MVFPIRVQSVSNLTAQDTQHSYGEQYGLVSVALHETY